MAHHCVLCLPPSHCQHALDIFHIRPGSIPWLAFARLLILQVVCFGLALCSLSLLITGLVCVGPLVTGALVFVDVSP